MFGIGDDYNVEKTAKKIFGAKKIFHTPYSKNTNTLFKRKMSKTFTTLDSHTDRRSRRPAPRLLRLTLAPAWLTRLGDTAWVLLDAARDVHQLQVLIWLLGSMCAQRSGRL
jgi:hypothetical protein